MLIIVLLTGCHHDSEPAKVANVPVVDYYDVNLTVIGFPEVVHKGDVVSLTVVAKNIGTLPVNQLGVHVYLGYDPDLYWDAIAGSLVWRMPINDNAVIFNGVIPPGQSISRVVTGTVNYEGVDLKIDSHATFTESAQDHVDNQQYSNSTPITIVGPG